MILDFDKAIFFFFQDLQRPWLDYFLAWPTHLGKTIPALTLVVLGILIFDRGPKAFEKAGTSAAAVIVTYWLTQFFKHLFNRPRPHLFWPDVHVIFEKPMNNAFPSGHTAIVFAAAFALDHLYPKKMKWTYGAALWVAVTRVYVGAHYPSDLLGGWVLGIGTAAAVFFLFGRLQRFQK